MVELIQIFPKQFNITNFDTTAIFEILDSASKKSNFKYNKVLLSITLYLHFVGSKAKGLISKRVFQENKESQIFQKTNISYPLVRTRIHDDLS